MVRTIRNIALAAALSASVAAVGGVVAGPTSAHADSASQLCKQIIASNNLPNNGAHGACTSFFQSHDRSSASFEYFCKTDFVPAGVFATQGACVSTFNRTAKGMF